MTWDQVTPPLPLIPDQEWSKWNQSWLFDQRSMISDQRQKLNDQRSMTWPVELWFLVFWPERFWEIWCWMFSDTGSSLAWPEAEKLLLRSPKLKEIFSDQVVIECSCTFSLWPLQTLKLFKDAQRPMLTPSTWMIGVCPADGSRSTWQPNGSYHLYPSAPVLSDQTEGPWIWLSLLPSLRSW